MTVPPSPPPQFPPPAGGYPYRYPPNPRRPPSRAGIRSWLLGTGIAVLAMASAFAFAYAARTGSAAHHARPRAACTVYLRNAVQTIVIAEYHGVCGPSVRLTLDEGDGGPYQRVSEAQAYKLVTSGTPVCTSVGTGQWSVYLASGFYLQEARNACALFKSEN